MTIINQKSISGITSITFASAGDDLLTFHSNNGTERFRIDNSGNTKITAGIVTTLTVTGDVDIADKIVHTGDTNTAIRFPGNDTFTVETAGSEAFRVDGGQRLLVGTTSDTAPGGFNAKIQTASTSFDGSISLRRDSNNTGAQSLVFGKSRGSLNGNTIVQDGDTLGTIDFYGADGTDLNTAAAQILAAVDGSPGSNDMPGRLVFSTTADGASSVTERLRIDSSGRLMLGTTTEGNANADDLTVSSSGHCGVTIRAGTTSSNSNIYFSDGTSGASEYAGYIQFSHVSDTMKFGIQGNDAVYIDSDRRLLVGNPNARGNFYNSSGAETRFLVEGTTFTTSSAALVRNSNNASDAELVLAKSRGTSVGSNTVVQDDDNLGAISFQGSDGAQFVEAASITAFVDATPGSNDMPGRLSFAVTSDGASTTTERMRINKLGFLKTGPRITDGSHGVANLDSARHEFTSDNNGWTIIVTHTSGAASEHEGILIDYANSPNGTGNSFLQGNDSNGTRFRMASNGGLYNYQSNNSNLSDEREKKNIVSLDTKWDKVKSWELKKFHYNEDADSDDLRYGVIAQQVEEHCPEVLSEWVKQEAKDAVLDGDGNVVTPAVAEVTRKGVKEQQMMWMAIKALQEAQTRIETLEAKVATLEG